MLQRTEIDALTEYLYSCGMEQCAIAVQRAAFDAVRRAENPQAAREFSPRVNALLCNALFTMNCDRRTSPEGKEYMRTLISDYRAAYMMPQEDFEAAGDEESLAEDNCAPFDGYILQNTEPGAAYDMQDIYNDIASHFMVADTDFLQSRVRDSVESLVRSGLFVRTSQKDVFERT